LIVEDMLKGIKPYFSAYFNEQQIS
jgi:hypothetical protein